MKRALRSLLYAVAVPLAFASPEIAYGGDLPVAEENANQIELAQSQAGFERWKSGFRSRARRQGISARVFDAAFRNVGINSDVLRLDRRQAEFTKQIWEYLDSAASSARVETGREMRQVLRPTMIEIERRYKVDARAVLAIWGLETNFGKVMGDINVIESLATPAYDGRRRKFAEEQLIAALSIIQSGDITPQAMTGSWAGAMGHTQFIPTSFLAYAVDFNGDGKRDIWNRRNPADALASAANYLKRFGWTYKQPWGMEVVLPRGFDYAMADQKIRRDTSEWNARGVRTVDGKTIPNHGKAAILAPAGARGPAFVLFNNFRVIKRYNNATAYAMGVGLLGDRIWGAGNFRQAWPRGDKALSRTQKTELQRRLTALGFSTQGVDGIIGPNTTSAIRSYQRSRGLVPDGYPSMELLRRLQ
jgi:membrane-bound lytic murein transglycosylase B